MVCFHHLRGAVPFFVPPNRGEAGAVTEVTRRIPYQRPLTKTAPSPPLFRRATGARPSAFQETHGDLGRQSAGDVSFDQFQGSPGGCAVEGATLDVLVHEIVHDATV